MADDKAPLGPWANADLNSTARESAGIGADEGLPLSVRFMTNVAKLIRRRVAEDSNGNDSKALAIFLLRPSPTGLELPNPPKRVPMLDNGLTPLCGRLWLVGGGSGSGFYSDHNSPPDQDLFELVVGKLGIGDCAAVVYDPRPTYPAARFYPNGLRDPDEYEFISIATEAVDYEKVVSVVDSVYSASLVTPEAQPDQGRVWQNPVKCWPSKKAEAIVQVNLKAGLAGAFPTCTIRHEQHMPEGRLDLEIEQSDPLDRSKVTRHAILELKILRSFGETGRAYTAEETESWIKSGVEQASAYRQSKGAIWSALFCFDMRKQEMPGEKCFAKVLDLAKKLNVFLRKWHLFSTSDQYRKGLALTC